MNPIPMSDFAAQILTVYSHLRAPKTRYRVAQMLAALEALGVTSTAELTTATMVRYIVEMGASNHNTLAGCLGTMRSLCSFAIAEGWLDRQPHWRRLWPKPTPTVLNVALDAADVAKLLAHLEERATDWQGLRLSALAHLVAHTGVRLGEAAHALVEDLDLDRGYFTVNPLRHPLKTVESARAIPLPDVVLPVLARWAPLTGCPWLFPGARLRGPWLGGWTVTKPLHGLQEAARQAGVGRVTWHSLRHTYASAALEEWRVPIWVVQRCLGHTSVRTTERYVRRIQPEKFARELRGVGYRRSM